jgi:hypothetical protein
MFTKAGLLIALLLVFLGYRWGKRKTQERLAPPPAQAVQAAPVPPAAPKKEWLSVRTLLIAVAILLVIAILSSLQR